MTDKKKGKKKGNKKEKGQAARSYDTHGRQLNGVAGQSASITIHVVAADWPQARQSQIRRPSRASVT